MSKVSVIIPCYNEEATIRLLLEALYQQTYARGSLEVIVADGMSTDRTRPVIEAFASEHPDLCVKVIENARRSIPAALNTAIQAAAGEFIVRLDAHSVPRPDYVSRCIQALEEDRGETVGGVWEIHPANSSRMARSIAAAAAHPLGVGDALYRFTEVAQYVDTVPFGSYRRGLVAKMGGYDENLLTNEDYEFNTRVRQSQGKVWLDPAIRSTYFARSSLLGLARQYWRYGYWKVRMLHRYPASLRWRQALPPLFVLSLGALALLSIPFAPARWILLLELAVYLLALFAASFQQARKNHDPSMLAGIPIAIATMHLAWGGAFLWSAVTLPFQARPSPNP